MKGEIFVEFVNMVEERFGLDLADRTLEHGELATKRVYTSVGDYDHEELVSLVSALSIETGLTCTDLMHRFGKFLFARLALGHNECIHGYDNVFDLFVDLEGVIHNSVQKLYPNAELPSIEVRVIDETTIEVKYYSKRGFADLCHGLADGCIHFFQEPINVERLACSDNDQTSCTLFLSKVEWIV